MSDLAIPPRVTGRHRDSVLAAQRRAYAVRLRGQGMTYYQIAKEMGYSAKGQVQRIVKKAAEAHVVEETDVMFAMERDRLRRLLRAAWPKAMEGDIAAGRQVLRVIEMEIKLLRLDEAEEVTSMPRTGLCHRRPSRAFCVVWRAPMWVSGFSRPLRGGTPG